MSDKAKQILERAGEISAETGVPLAEALRRAEAEAAPAPEGAEFVVRLRLKPRVAAWVREALPPLPGYTTEDRLAATLGPMLARLAVEDRAARAVAGPGVSMTRAQYEQRLAGGDE